MKWLRTLVQLVVGILLIAGILQLVTWAKLEPYREKERQREFRERQRNPEKDPARNPAFL